MDEHTSIEPIKFDDQCTSDIIIRLKNSKGSRQLFHSHLSVLKSKSLYFADRLSGPSSDCLEIECGELDYDHYLKLVKCLYLPEDSLLNSWDSVRSCLGVLRVASKLRCESVVGSCVRFLEAVPWEDSEEDEIVNVVSRLGEKMAAPILARVQPVDLAATKRVLIAAIRFATSGPGPYSGDGPDSQFGNGPGTDKGDGPCPHFRDGPGPHKGDVPSDPHLGDRPDPHKGDGLDPHFGDGPGPQFGYDTGPHFGDGHGSQSDDGPGPLFGDGPGPQPDDGPGSYFGDDEVRASAREQVEYMLADDDDGDVTGDRDVRDETKIGLSRAFVSFERALSELEKTEKTDGILLRCLSNLEWLCTIATRMGLMGDFISGWIDVSGRALRAAEGESGPTWGLKAKLVHVTSKVLDAVGYGSVIVAGPERAKLVKTWLPFVRKTRPVLDSIVEKDEGFPHRVDEDVWQSVEGAMVSLVSALPSNDQAEILAEWMAGNEQLRYPDLSEAFEVWCFRSKSAKRRLVGVEEMERVDTTITL